MLEVGQKTFRTWLNDMYVENCRERNESGMPIFDGLGDYFTEYRWWLKREYQRKQKVEKGYDNV